MPKRQAVDELYMQVAERHAQMSHAKRKKVGACLVLRSGGVMPGYNGTVKGSDNACEDVIDGELRTKPEVLHAELNCILKCAKEGVSSEGSTLYVTLSPCESCASMIAEAGIRRVVYKEKYRCEKGIEALIKYNILVNQFKYNQDEFIA